MKTYRLGIVGLGRMGSTIDAEVEDYPAITLPYSIAAAAKAIPQLELAAGCDLVVEKNKAFSQKWGVPMADTYKDYGEMLKNAKLDIVAICTPGPLHARMTIAAAQAGASMIYCEKAMACSMKEADEVKKILESRHTVYNTGVLRRFDPRYHQARDLIQKGRIGAPRAAVHYASASLLHGHIHSVDTILFLLGDKRVKSVWGELRPRDIIIKNKRLDKDPLAIYQLEVEGGVEAATVPAGNWDFEVIGDEGVLRSRNNNIEWSLRTRRPLGKKFHTFQPVEYPRVAPRSATVNCLRDMVDAHEKHRPSQGDVALAHHATEVCLAVAECHLQGGQRVTLPMKERELYVYHF
jgi:predicted dehydrogenase